MAVRDILIWPNPKLRELTFPVGGNTQLLRKLRDPMSWKKRAKQGGVDRYTSTENIEFPGMTDDMRELVYDLADTMKDRDGAGIAAPQIGVSVGIFLIANFVAGGDGKNPLVFINPEITWVSEEKIREKEGCLSFPDIWVFIERPARCRVRAINLDGEEFEVDAEGIYARALQHENDHLHGILLTDFVGRLRKNMIRKKLQKKPKKKMS